MSEKNSAPISVVLATFFGVGFLPGGPGTYAAILALPLIWLTTELPMVARVVLFIVVTALSMFWSERAGKVFEETDSRKIVIDEVVGVWTTLLLFEADIAIYVIGLIAFRVFDILKPPPIRWLDQHVKGGVGVVVDDLLAGVFGAVVVAAYVSLMA